MRSPVITEFAAASAAPNPPVLSFSSDSAFQIKTAALNDIPQWACLQEAGGCGSLAFDGHSFQLLQFHFHTPSENTADGLHFPLEMHMVYCSGACQLGVDRFAVVGVLFELGPEEDTTPTTDLIEQMWAAVDQHMLNKDKDKSENVKAGQNQDPDSDGGDEFANRFTFDLSALFGKHNHYRATESFLHWKGSLTTPPCTEGLDWLLLNDIAPVDSDGTASPRLVQHIKPSQLARFLKQIKGYPGNSRPTQPLYGRNIIRY